MAQKGIKGRDMMFAPGGRDTRVTGTIDGHVVIAAYNGLLANTDIRGFIERHGGKCDVSNIKADYKELKPKATTKVDLYMELAGKFYLRFKSADHNEIKYSKSSVLLGGDDPTDDYVFQYKMLNPATYLISLYVIHLALQEKWDDGDNIKAQLLRERIETYYPEHTKYLQQITLQIEDMDPMQFLENNKENIRNSEIIDAPPYFEKMDLPEYFIDEIRYSRLMQFNLWLFIKDEVMDKIYSKGDNKKMWNWGNVRQAMSENRLFVKNKRDHKHPYLVSSTYFARCIFPFLPEKFKAEKITGETEKELEESKKRLLASIKRQVDHHEKCCMTDGTDEFERVKYIKLRLDKKGLYKPDKDGFDK